MGQFDRRAVDRLSPYRLPQEHLRVAMQEHWAAKVEPITTATVGLILVLFINAAAPARLGTLTNISWWLWFALLLRVAWDLLNWRVSWFIATNKRLLLLYGLITKKVAMMPLSKVTDMSYSRSPMGMLLGYGTFTLESAGQEQALHQITYVRDPDHTYRAICQEIFGNPDGPQDGGPPDDRNHDPDPGDSDGPHDGGPGGPGDDDPYSPHDDDPTDVPVQRLGSYLLGEDGSGHGRRWLRRRRHHDDDGNDEQPKIPGIISGPEEPSWQVSHEDASPREEVPRRSAGWWD